MAGNIGSAAAPITSSLSKLQALNGLFAIYKKQGPTSADVLNALKEALLKEAGVQNPNPRKRKKQSLKMGHGGTLDSAASGVLGISVQSNTQQAEATTVVGIGNGTKMLSTMLAGSKKYVAVGELGKATDTLDATGSVILEKDFEHITRLDIEDKLKAFTGDIMQVPPLYSALKKDGQRLSVLLKKGHKVEAKPARPVTVYNLTLQEFKPPHFTLDIECGGGFYVRSLVDDLGKALSSCAHVKELIRTKQGQFTLEEHALHEEQWTLERILFSLQPCSESEQALDCTKPPEADTLGTHSEVKMKT
ncbi:probable tRNA pseudouridine synthase 1 isoform X2 [Micropterus dolomieu]|uniref:probable tRNA pseudouridine synthase 1 isoform X2 n=1 Tax=Micropterus dolomieu TaxID=147949 RepID=UPI001E8EB8A1|nr:probable tRNA pseudouridine synthase 1 isoform X2 [Micropterus dolomieu]